MFRNFLLEFIIAVRYLRGQSRTTIFSLGTRLSFVFMTLMVFIMVLVLSVFTGFQQEVHNSLWNSGYHITISRQAHGKPLGNYEDIVKSVETNPDLKSLVRSAYGSIALNALLEVNQQFEGKAVRAIPVTAAELARGELKDYPPLVHYNQDYLNDFDGGNYVLVGREMARYFGWQVGDRIRLFLPLGGNLSRESIAQINQQDFRIAGFFRTGFYEFDLNLIFMSFSTAQKLMGLRKNASEVIVQLNDLSKLDQARTLIKENLPGNAYTYQIRTIRDERGNFLAALQLEKTLMIIILSLLILAGVAGIWVTVHLLVKAKSKSIGMLRAMGLSTRSVLMIFTANSMLIGLLATGVGGSLGIYIALRLESIIQLVEDFLNQACHWVQNSCAPVQLIPRNIYYFDHLPVYADITIIFGIALTTIILSGLAGFFPSRRAAMLDPVQTIRQGAE